MKREISSRYHEFFLLFGDEILHFFEWTIFKTFATVTFHYRIYAQLDGFFIPGLYNIHTHRFGSKTTNEKSSQGWYFPTKQFGCWWAFLGNEMNKSFALFSFAYCKPSNVCRLCEFFFRVFRGVLGMKALFLGRIMTLPNCGVKPVRSQQDWIVSSNSWNCPSTLCHTRKIIITRHYVYLGIFTNLNYPLFMFQCFYGRTQQSWFDRFVLCEMFENPHVQKQCKVGAGRTSVFEIIGI